jgi:hypothetical protein
MPAQTLRKRPVGAPAHPPWWIPIVLSLPAFVPLLASILVARAKGLVATWFVTIDQPYYFADARQFFNHGFHLLYANPYGGYDAPRIYFQPHLFLLGCFQQLGLDPGVTWVLFGAAGTLFAAFVAVRLYREVVGWHGTAEKIGLLCFFWGGGLLTLAGFGYAAAIGKLNIDTVLHFDPGPARGWWRLDFGRNLIYGPTEAYYHAVFFLTILFLIWRRFGPAVFLAALLSLSHPFAGLECSLVVAAYLAGERVLGDESVKPAHLVASGAVLCFHLWYYLFFLNQFADHRAMQGQWERQGIARGWFYPPSTFVPVLAIVGALAAVSLWRWPGFRKVVRNPGNRLFIVWFLVVFALTQHNLIMRPIQPIHFAGGYDWTALFLLGAPVLVSLLNRLLEIRARPLQISAIAVFLVFFLSDNIFWFAAFSRPHAVSMDVVITPQQKEVLDWLGRTAAPPAIVVTGDRMLGYLVSTYTLIRSWEGHGNITPHAEERRLESKQAFEENMLLPVWNGMHVFYIQRSSADATWKPPVSSKEVFRNADYVVWEYIPPK